MRPMSFFIEESTKVVKLDDKNSITLLSGLSAEEFMKLDKEIGFENLQTGEVSISDILKLIEIFLVDWELLDTKGNKVEFSKAKIKRLSGDALNLITKAVMDVIQDVAGVDKKKELELNKLSQQVSHQKQKSPTA